MAREKEKEAFGRLLDIMDELREKCPWDMKQTMESLRQPGLYLIGEVVDVTGHLGGYNFQWAWASGWAAGTAIANRG